MIAAAAGVSKGACYHHFTSKQALFEQLVDEVQATIAARIDRLDPDAKCTLSAAAVVGSRFGLDLLMMLSIKLFWPHKRH